MGLTLFLPGGVEGEALYKKTQPSPGATSTCQVGAAEIEPYLDALTE
jgi:hypothetical protein